MLVTMLRGLVRMLFLSWMGTWGYSSGSGSVASQAAACCLSTASTLLSLSAGTQPSRKRVAPVERRRLLTSSRCTSWVSRSMVSFRASL